MILHSRVVQQNRACVSDIKRNQCPTPDQKRKKQLIQHHLILLEELARGQKQEYHIRILARGKSA